MRHAKGSLTVEAVISVTIFISVMFLLLTMVKLVLMMTILNNATVEAAKVIATGAYPISILNEKQAGLESLPDEAEPATLTQSLAGAGSSSIITSLFGGDGWSAFTGSGVDILKDLVGGVGVELSKNIVYELKGKAVSALCGQVVSGYVEDCGIAFDPEQLLLRAVKIPQTSEEFSTLYRAGLSLSDSGALTAQPASSPTAADGDFNAEDVLICLEYPYEMALPFLPAITITLRSVSVEHAWLYGTSVGPSRMEGIDVTNILFGSGTTVYVATGGHGTRYHRENCSTLWTSNSPISLAEAQSQGLTPCKVCNPPTS